MLKRVDIEKIGGDKDRYYFGQVYYDKDKEKDIKHGKGILFIPGQNLLYYGFFKDNKKHGFGRCFYDERDGL